MLPRDLKIEQFAGYPPEARKVIAAHLTVLRQLPLSFVPSLLREVIEYDFKFPAERTAIDSELANLSALSDSQLKAWFAEFAQLSLSSSLEQLDWINLPVQFVEQQSAYLWSTHQLDSFRKAATDYGARLAAVAPPEPIPVPRLGIAVIGQGVTSFDEPLFRNLRKYGTYFSQVKPEGGLEQLLACVESRAKARPFPYGHWYVDGGQAISHNSSLTCISYHGLDQVRVALLRKMQTEIKRPGMGPEELRTYMARLTPTDVGMDDASDPVLARFQLKLLTEGSGTQIFSTTFAQWATREVLRRAQALTLLVRFAPRQRQRPMNELLSNVHGEAEPDALGSLVDADMGAYYHWINQQRLTGAERSSFIVWFEGHGQAIAISPTLPRGAESSSAIDLAKMFALVTT
jgi:hypothetical protein